MAQNSRNYFVAFSYKSKRLEHKHLQTATVQKPFMLFCCSLPLHMTDTLEHFQFLLGSVVRARPHCEFTIWHLGVPCRDGTGCGRVCYAFSPTTLIYPRAISRTDLGEIITCMDLNLGGLGGSGEASVSNPKLPVDQRTKTHKKNVNCQKRDRLL